MQAFLLSAGVRISSPPTERGAFSRGKPNCWLAIKAPASPIHTRHILEKPIAKVTGFFVSGEAVRISSPPTERRAFSRGKPNCWLAIKAPASPIHTRHILKKACRNAGLFAFCRMEECKDFQPATAATSYATRACYSSPSIRPPITVTLQ